MTKTFQSIKTNDELAEFFGLSYKDLADLIYKSADSKKYFTFEIKKRNGGTRVIKSPNDDLKYIQRTLRNEFYDIYPGKASAHGFCQDKSVVTNAKQHLGKRYIFNIDLEDFFDSISFVRIRSLFQSNPFNFPYKVSTVLAHICCFQNSLPQGAPTSPVLSNMIAWKLDANLQHLAKKSGCIYTRYADDITFSFTYQKSSIPKDIILFSEDGPQPGKTLTSIIEKNGFKINQNKVRFAGKNKRMEVTGIVVNDFLNTPRAFIKQVSAMLHAWAKFGIDAAEKEHLQRYDKKQSSNHHKSFDKIVKGKISFIRQVRGDDDEIVKNLARRFNSLSNKNKIKLKTNKKPEEKAIDSLWVIEACYDDPKTGKPHVTQGTGFHLEGAGIVTCAHVVTDDHGKPLENLTIRKYHTPEKEYNVNVKATHKTKDLAILCFEDNDDYEIEQIPVGKTPIKIMQSVYLFGFPSHGVGNKYYIAKADVAQEYTKNGVKKFEIDKQIREGNSGGPILNENFEAIGVAAEGATKSGGHNGCILIDEVFGI